jgi:hypothetical protein
VRRRECALDHCKQRLNEIQSQLIEEESSMFKTLAATSFAAALTLLSSTAFAQQGNSSAWGTVGWGPVIPTQSLTPKERQWNFDNEAKNEAENGAEYLRQHRMGLFPFFQ